MGYKAGGIVYIYLPGMAADWFAQNSAYPLPFALVLTSIVIGASTMAVMLGIIIVLYKNVDPSVHPRFWESSQMFWFNSKQIINLLSGLEIQIGDCNDNKEVIV